MPLILKIYVHYYSQFGLSLSPPPLMARYARRSGVYEGELAPRPLVYRGLPFQVSARLISGTFRDN